MGNSEAKKKQKQEQDLKKLQQNQKLISIATIFLAGKDVERISDTQKKIFLRRKGLTQQMVEQAFKRFKEKKEKEEAKPTLIAATPTPAPSPEADKPKTQSTPDKTNPK